MKRFLSLLIVACLLLSMCFSLASCSGSLSKKNYTWVDLLFDACKNYDASEWEEFMEDYEEFVNIYVLAYDKELSYLDEMKYTLGLLYYLNQATSIMEEFSAMSEDEYDDNYYEIERFFDEWQRVNQMLPEEYNSTVIEAESETETETETETDTLREYDVTEWKELMVLYEEYWDAYWIASDAYDADPTNTQALEERNRYSNKIYAVGVQLEGIRYALSMEAENGSAEAQAELDEFGSEIVRIQGKR